MGEPIKPEPSQKLLSPPQIADLLGVSVKTIYHWVHRKGIPFIKVGKHLRFNSQDVIRYFQQRTGDAGTPCPQTSTLVDSGRFRSLKNW